MLLELRIWREGKNILVRNDRFHINTYGKTLEDALKNFKDALSIAVSESDIVEDKTNSKIYTLVRQYQIQKSFFAVQNPIESN